MNARIGADLLGQWDAGVVSGFENAHREEVGLGLRLLQEQVR